MGGHPAGQGLVIVLEQHFEAQVNPAGEVDIGFGFFAPEFFPGEPGAEFRGRVVDVAAAGQVVGPVGVSQRRNRGGGGVGLHRAEHPGKERRLVGDGDREGVDQRALSGQHQADNLAAFGALVARFDRLGNHLGAGLVLSGEIRGDGGTDRPLAGHHVGAVDLVGEQGPDTLFRFALDGVTDGVARSGLA